MSELRNITLTAREELIDRARARARADNTTLNEQFRLWLAGYAEADRTARYERAMAGLRGKVVVGRALTRDERNAR